MQKQTTKIKSTQKLGKKNLEWKSQPWRKVNAQSQRLVKVNGQPWEVNSQIPIVKGWRQQLTQVGDISNGVGKGWRGWHQQARESAWGCVGARDGVWRRVIWKDGAWGRMQSPTASRLSQVCRLAQDDLCGTFKTVIGAMFVAVMQTAVVCVVWNPLTTAVVGPEPKDDGWVTSEVQWRKAAAVVVMAEAILKKKNRSHTNKKKIAKKRSE